MGNDKPRISIGMPVHNGEKYINEAIDSILAQTYSNFELIISDNASTDRTKDICTAYSSKDRRISYYRNERNIGAAKNFNRVFELSSGEYFKWEAYDDVLATDFLLKCVEVLDSDPNVVLCYSKIKFINENGKFLRNYDVKLNKVGSKNPQDRFRELILTHRLFIEIFGLIRSRILKMTPLIANYVASDIPLLAELGLLGRFYEIPEYLIFSRDHSDQSIRAIPIHFRAYWFDPSKADETVFPHWRIYQEYFKCVKRSSLSNYERMICYLYLLRWVTANLNWARMLADLIIAIEPRSANILLRIKEWYYKSRNDVLS